MNTPHQVDSGYHAHSVFAPEQHLVVKCELGKDSGCVVLSFDKGQDAVQFARVINARFRHLVFMAVEATAQYAASGLICFVYP